MRFRGLRVAVLVGLMSMLVGPAAAEETPKPVYVSAVLGADRTLLVEVNTDPQEGENTYGYMQVTYLKWNATKQKFVRKASWQAVWNSDKQLFEAKFEKAAARGKCKLVSKYQQYLSTPYETAPVTKAAKRFKCGLGF